MIHESLETHSTAAIATLGTKPVEYGDANAVEYGHADNWVLPVTRNNLQTSIQCKPKTLQICDKHPLGESAELLFASSPLVQSPARSLPD